MDQALQILRWQQEELLAGIEFVKIEKLNKIEDGQRWSILGIVRHLAFAELWYLQNLGIPTPEFSGDTDPIYLIEQSYNAVASALPTLIGDSRITENTQERWSARKLVRRTLWHRRDHIDHIRQLLGVI